MSLRAGILSRGRFTYRGQRGGSDHVQGMRARTVRSRAALSGPSAATAHRSPLIMAVTSDHRTKALPPTPRQAGPPSVEGAPAEAAEAAVDAPTAEVEVADTDVDVAAPAE